MSFPGTAQTITNMGAIIAQRIRLRLPPAAPGSSPKHTIYFYHLYPKLCYIVI